MTRTKHLLLGISIGVIIIIAAVSVRGCYAATPEDKIRFTDLPQTIDMKPGSQASFDVTLRNFGNQYADVSINVRSLPDALTIVSGDEERLLDMGKSVTYHITISASDDIVPGTHQFEIADKSNVDQHTWAPISVRVKGSVPTPPANATPGQTEAKKSPGFGVVAMVFALLLAYRSGRTQP
ncbi:MAG: hypothetical protein U9N12_07810 [Euryarchaeota archaeon]|nr:hypothetical protein [Euryarchaeota archaeon]